MVQGGYDLFLDDEQICDGVSATEAARYVNDTWLYGGAVEPEHLDAAGKIDPVLPPDIVSELLAKGVLPPGSSAEGLRPEEP